MPAILSFPKPTIIAAATLTAAACMLTFIFFSHTKEDSQEYLALVSQAQQEEEKTSDSYSAKQQRHQLHKHLWLNTSGEEHQLSIRGTDAELILNHHDETSEVVENMYHMSCCMQEELYYILPDGTEVVLTKQGGLLFRNQNNDTSSALIPDQGLDLKPMQIIRYMEADKASYHYKTDKLVAEKVYIARYIMPGHDLIEKFEGHEPLMTGNAESVEFTLNHADPEFKAHQFKAILHKVE